MSAVNIDPNSWPAFVLRWTFAGLWGAVGWALASRYLIPHLPGL